MNEIIVEYLTAVLETDYKKIEDLLESGLDVDICCIHGNTAMRNASQAGDLEMLKFLISKGAGVNRKINCLSPVDGRFEEGFTPIFYAHDAETLKFLVDSGGNINATCAAGYTALMKCCKYSYDSIVPIIEMHLKCGADISITAPIGKKGKHVGAMDIALDTKSFYERLYKKARNEKLARCIANSETIVDLLSEQASSN